MPKSYLQEAYDWLVTKEMETAELLTLEDDSDYDYYVGLHEAYGVAVSKIGELLNGKN
jgi:hypothetical protein